MRMAGWKRHHWCCHPHPLVLIDVCDPEHLCIFTWRHTPLDQSAFIYIFIPVGIVCTLAVPFWAFKYTHICVCLARTAHMCRKKWERLQWLMGDTFIADSISDNSSQAKTKQSCLSLRSARLIQKRNKKTRWKYGKASIAEALFWFFWLPPNIFQHLLSLRPQKLNPTFLPTLTCSSFFF